MKVLNVRDMIWTNAAHTAFDCVIELSEGDALPFTAKQGDPHGHGIFEEAVLGTFGPIVEYSEPVLSPEQVLAEKKRQRKKTVDSSTVRVSSGKIFDGDEEAQSRMTRAVVVAGIAGLTECTWVLANNVPTTVTFTELKEALTLAMQAQGAVWASPYL